MAEFKDIKKILVIKLRHIGDVLLTIPAIRALRDTFPDAYIAALVNKGTEEMLAGNPLLNSVMTFDRAALKAPFYKRVISELAFAKHIRSIGFDMAIDLTSGDRPAIYSFISGARYRMAYDPEGGGFWGKRYLYTHLGKRLNGGHHEVLQNLYLAKQFGIDTDNLEADIYFTKGDEKFVDSIFESHHIKPDRPFIHIHPTSRWLFKCWKDKYMAEVIDFCERDMGVRVVITSAPDKRELNKIENIMRDVKSSPVNLAGALTLKHLAVLSRRASLFFGVDSAPMHIAAAVNTPVVALFGPSGAFHWGPWDNKESSKFKVQSSKYENPYQRENGVQTFGRHTVIQRDWDCIPCGKDGCNGSKISRCLEDIKPEDVKNILLERLKEAEHKC